MRTDYLGTCLIASVLLHATILTTLSLPESPLKAPAPKKVIEVAYEGALAVEKEPQKKQEYTRFESKKPKLPNINTAIRQDTLQTERKELTRQDIFDVKIPDIPGEIFKTPEYKSYYQIIREKIRKYAYFNYKRLNEGEVYLTFTLSPSGEVSELSINDQRSVDNDYLRSIAQRSVREASPYPPFPEKLKANKKLSFNVIISFELK